MSQQPTGLGYFIAEKSSAMRDFQSVYNKIKNQLPYQLEFGKFHGHVVEFPKPQEMNPDWAGFNLDNLPMIPTEWNYKPIPNINLKTMKVDAPVDKLYLEVKSALESGKYDFVVCGTDPEREGNLIFDAFISTLSPNIQAMKKFRFWNNGMSDSEIEKAFKNLLSYSDKIGKNTGTVQELSDAALLRAKTDWLIGMNGSQAVSIKAGFPVNIGRVLDPVENLIVQRELQIRNFKPEQFFTVKQTFSQNEKEFSAVLVGEDNQPLRFKTELEAQKVLNLVSQVGTSAVTSVVAKEEREKPYQFYSTGSIQGAASDLYGYSQDKTDAILQSLYLTKKISTYPRTDTMFITDEMATKDLPGVIDTALQVPQLSNIARPSDEVIKSLSKNKRYVDDSKVGGHGALQPLGGVRVNFGALTEEEKNVFYLISRSQLLPFLGDVVTNKTSVMISVGDYLFRANGSVLVDPGFSEYVPEKKFKGTPLPEIVEGAADILAGEVKEGWTAPPKRYKVSEFTTILENIHRLVTDDEQKLAMKQAEGLGRPSTRSEIIKKLIDHSRIGLGKDKRYFATDFGIEVNSKLAGNDILSPELTARLETMLQNVEKGTLSVSDYYSYVLEFTNNFLSNLKRKEFTFENIPDYAKKNQPICIIAKTGTEVRKGKDSYFDSDFVEWMTEREEAEKEGAPVPEFRGFFLRKSWDNDSFKMTGTFSDKDVVVLAQGKTIEKEFFLKKFDQKSTKEIFLNDKLQVAFVPSKNKQSVEEFLVNGETVFLVSGQKGDREYSFYQIGGRQNGWQIWSKVFGKEITKDDLSALLNKEEVWKEGLIFNNGKTGDAFIYVDFNEKKLKLRFPERKGSSGERLFDSDGTVVDKFISKTGTPFFKINNNVFVYGEMFGHKMSEDDVITLAVNKELFVDDFVSKKTNENYSGFLRVVGEEVKLFFE